MHDGINWGDVPTWLAVVVATFGGYAALRQLRLQQEDLRRQVAQLERQQAEQIGFTRERTQLEEPGGFRSVVMLVVENVSPRPIRFVQCKLHLESPLDSWFDPPHTVLASLALVGVMIPTGMPPGTDFFEPQKATRSGSVDVIRAGQKFGFKFDAPWDEYQNAWMVVEFLDDAGVSWVIDRDLHLSLISRSEPSPRPNLGRRVALRVRWRLRRRSRRTAARRPGPPAER